MSITEKQAEASAARHGYNGENRFPYLYGYAAASADAYLDVLRRIASGTMPRDEAEMLAASAIAGNEPIDQPPPKRDAAEVDFDDKLKW